MERLRNAIKKLGERLPKKHGEWYRIYIYDNNYLLLDTWNNKVYHHKECESSGTDNMYGVIYTFSGYAGTVKKHMAGFWNSHIQLCVKSKIDINTLEARL